jgi:uncharacterized YigZ family protein
MGASKPLNYFSTLARSGEAETRVSASRFIAFAFPADDEEVARQLFRERERKYFDATHHCAAWRFRSGGFRAIDAGEPHGSAGFPILAAIDGAGLVDTGVVVTRYFGGTKLGTGGLARAYTEAAAAALAAAPTRRGREGARVKLRHDYPHTSTVMRLIERFGGRDIEQGFAADVGLPEVFATVPTESVKDLESSLRDQTGGAVLPEVMGSTVLYEDA